MEDKTDVATGVALTGVLLDGTTSDSPLTRDIVKTDDNNLSAGKFTLQPVFQHAGDEQPAGYLAWYGFDKAPSFAVGLDSVAQFRKSSSAYASLRENIVYQPQHVREVNLAVTNTILSGDLGKLATMYPRAWEAAGKDPGWWFELSLSIAGALPEESAPVGSRGRVSGDPGVLRAKLASAAGGDLPTAAELRVAKLLRAEGRNVHLIDDSLTPGVTQDFLVDGSLRVDVKRISGLGRNAAGDLAKGVGQVGPGGEVIVVRPDIAKQTLAQYQDFVQNFKPSQPGVTFRVVDEASLPTLFYQR